MTTLSIEKFTVESLLGGAELLGHAIHSEMDMYALSKKGLPKKSLLSLSDQIDLSLKAMAALLHVTERTIQRKGDDELLDEVTSAQLLQIAEVYSRGAEVFDSTEDFQVWMRTVSPALGHQRPLDLLSSSYGAQMVLDELGRIEYGVFA